jgi:hypothetical protein
MCEEPMPEPRAPITVRFMFTLDELAEVAERGVTSRPSHHRRRLNSAILVGLAAGGGAYLATATRPGSGGIYVLGAFVIATGAVYFLVPLMYRPRIMELLRERVQGEGPFECVVTLDASGVTFKQIGMTITREWPAMKDVAEGKNGIELIGRDGSISLVRERAFGTPAARAEFIAYAREMLDSRLH